MNQCTDGWTHSWTDAHTEGVLYSPDHGSREAKNFAEVQGFEKEVIFDKNTI